MGKRVGLMGCGSVADFGHVPAILATPELELAALYDPNPDRVRYFQAKFGPRFGTSDIEEFWAQNLDSAVVASPAGAHKHNVLEAAKRGVHVLCEKPIALSDEDGKEMAEAMEAAGLLFGIGYCYRFAPVSERIKDLVTQGGIGQVRSLRLHYIWNLHGIHETLSDGQKIYSLARKARMDEGGPMVDCGVHCIDLARWWLNSEIVQAEGHGAWIENYAAPDHMYAHLDHADGAHTVVEMSFSYTHTAKDPISYFHYHLIGTEGVILYDRDAGRFELRNGHTTEPLGWSHEKNFPGMYAAWAKCLATQSLGDFPSARDGILATRIATDVTEQAMLRRPSQFGV